MKKIIESTPESTLERMRRKIRLSVKNPEKALKHKQMTGRVVPKKTADNDPTRNKASGVRKRKMSRKWHMKNEGIEIANEFEKFARANSIIESKGTMGLWIFCEDNPVGQELVGNPDLEKSVRGILSNRGWKISPESSFLGEEADIDDHLDMVLNDE